MAWTTISDAALEVGKALRALTMRNLRDNIAAVAAGDAGAPKVQTAAIQDGAVTNAKFNDNSIQMMRLLYPTAGDGYVMRWLNGSTFGGSSALAYEDWTDPLLCPMRATAVTFGAVRLRFTHYGPGSVSYAWARVVVEGVVVAEWADIRNQAYIERVVDFAISPGARIVLQTHKDPAYPSSGGSFVLNARILSNTYAIGVA